MDDNTKIIIEIVSALFEKLKIQKAGSIIKHTNIAGISTLSNDPNLIFKRAVRAVDSVVESYGGYAEGDIIDKAEVNLPSNGWYDNKSYSFCIDVVDDGYSTLFIKMLVHQIPRHSGIKGCFAYIEFKVNEE